MSSSYVAKLYSEEQTPSPTLMAKTQRKTAYVRPEHHDILRRIAFEQRCSISDVLDAVLEQADWEAVGRESAQKPLQRAKERSSG